MSKPSTAVIVLAAGRGTRMHAKSKNKVAFQLGGKPMVQRTVENLMQANISNITIVVGFQKESVIRALSGFAKLEYVVQANQLGTANAVKSATHLLGDDIEKVLIISGDDSAFYPPALYDELIEKQEKTNADIVALTLRVGDPTGLGRIIEKNGQIQKIVKEKVATDLERKIQLINTSMYCIKKSFLLESLPKIKENPISKEYYLTDIIEIAVLSGHNVISHELKNLEYWHGVNNRNDLAKAQKKIKK